MKKGIGTLHIHISNISEDVWEFINTLPNEKKEFEIRENSELSDRDLFCFLKKENLIVIMPKSIDQDFLESFRNQFPRKFLQVLWPDRHSGELSLDIHNDQKLFRDLIAIMNEYEEVEITSYSSTHQFHNLCIEISKKAPHVTFPDTPEDTWTTDYFGTKAGFRQIQYDNHGKKLFPMCAGLSLMGVENASQAAAYFYSKYDGVVIKTNKGHAGMGVLIIRKGDLSTRITLSSQIAAKMTESYWNEFPITIEEFVSCDPSIGGGFPNAECYVSKKGTVSYLYSCGMRVNSSGEFKGVEIGVGAMEVSQESKLRTYGNRLGKMYAEANYCGFFDVDCLASKDGTIFVSESNVRRTGGTHVYLAALDLFGKSFAKKTYALSNNLYPIADKLPRSYQQLESSLEPILFDKKKKEGVLIVAANLLHRSVFGYIIFGNTKQRAYEIEETMEQLLRKHQPR